MFNTTNVPGPDIQHNTAPSVYSDDRKPDKYRTILNQLPVGIVQVGENEQILFVNTRFADMLGYLPEEFPRNIKDLINPDTYFHTQHTWKDMWQTTRQFQVDVRFRRKNGSYILTESVIRLVLNENGQLDFALIVSREADPDGKPVPERHISLFDPLTSLPTRNYLDSFLDSAIERNRQHGKMLGVLELNINRFKIINESLGHDAGDALLKLMAKRLIHAVHENDTVSRTSGDEFIVILEKIDHAADIVSIASRLMKTVTEPLQLSGHDLSIAVSIGGSLFPRDATDGSTLLKYAGVALAEARKKRSSIVRFFDSAMNVTPREKLMTESELHRALERREFILFYQPRLCLKTGSVVGLEALIRWNRPGEGIVSAANFIPLAEEIGLIEQIGTFVLAEVTRQLVEWRKEDLIQLPVAFNVSSRELYTPELAESLEKNLEKTGLSPDRFELEITESSLIEDMDKVRETLTHIREMGIPVSIDDFGTGYSSLRYLSALPIDLLKIDSSFITGLSGSDGMKSIVETTITMAHSLGMAVIAEGVSTKEQLDFLTAKGCDQIQGYLCSPALPPDELETFLQKYAFPLPDTSLPPLYGNPIGQNRPGTAAPL